jgi:hypothetical protein
MFSPTGAPSGLTQIEGAKGEQVPLGDGLGAVVPAGSKSEPVDSDKHGKSVIYRMPDVDANRLPYLKVIWGSPVNTMPVNPPGSTRRRASETRRSPTTSGRS